MQAATRHSELAAKTSVGHVVVPSSQYSATSQGPGAVALQITVSLFSGGCVQAPAAQTSALQVIASAAQASPSVTGVNTQSLVWSQVSTVQSSSLSSHKVLSVVPAQAPALHSSLVVQPTPSSQLVPVTEGRQVPVPDMAHSKQGSVPPLLQSVAQQLPFRQKLFGHCSSSKQLSPLLMSGMHRSVTPTSHQKSGPHCALEVQMLPSQTAPLQRPLPQAAGAA